MGKGNTSEDRPAKQDYETPQQLVDLFADMLGVTFSVDLAGTYTNKKAPQVISLDDDGFSSLEEPWEGWLTEFPGAGWLNPPYSNPECGRFVKKCCALPRHFDIVALVPACICTKWWLAANVPAHASIYPLFPRIPFVGMDQGIDRDLVLLVFDGLTQGLKDPIYWFQQLKSRGGLTKEGKLPWLEKQN